MKWFDNQHHNKANATTLPFQLHRVNDKIYDEIIKRNDEYFLIKRCGVMPFTGVHNFTEFVTDGYTLVYPLPRSQQQEIKLDWTPPRTQGDFTTFVINSGGVSPQIEGTLAIDRRYQEWRESKQGQTIMVAPFNIDYNREVYVDKIHGSEQPVGELVIDDEGNESYELAINTIESPNLKTYEGITHISSHGQTLSPHMEIQAKQVVDGEEVLSSFEGKNITISDSAMGEIESATLYGETLVNVIKEPKAEIVLPYSFEESESVTIEGTKETGSLGNVVLKGKTLGDIVTHCGFGGNELLYEYRFPNNRIEGGNKLAIVVTNSNITTIRVGRSNISSNTWIGETTYDVSTTKRIVHTVRNGEFCGYVGVVVKKPYDSTGYEGGLKVFKGGTPSVRMPVLKTQGKQLLNVNDLDSIVSTDGTIPTKPTVIDFENGIVQIEETSRENAKGYKIKVERNKDYIGTCNSTNSEYIRCKILDLKGNRLDEGQEYHSKRTFKFNSGENDYIVVAFTRHTISKLQVQLALYEGTVLPTTYEPYKSSILSTPEDVVLREIDGLQDTLNCSTSEKVQRVGEYQITGEENWEFLQDARRLQIVRPTFIPNIKCGKFACDILEAKQGNDHSLHGTNGTYYIGYTSDGWLRIILGEDLTSLEQGKEWLRNNKPVIQYELTKPIIEKIDLSIVDHNGVKKDKLQTFDGVTHLVTSVPVGSLNPIISHQPLEIPVAIKAGTQYSIIKDSYTNGHDNVPFTLDLGGAKASSQIGERVTLVTTPKTLAHNSLKPSGWGQKLTNLMIMEGDHTGSDAPYIEGMQSVANPVLIATGKNLFDKDAFYIDWKGKREDYIYNEIIDDEEVLKIHNLNALSDDNRGFKIFVEKDVPLTLTLKCKKAGTSDTNSVLMIRHGDSSYVSTGRCASNEWVEQKVAFTPTRNYITVCSAYNANDYFYIKDVQLEKGSTATPYELHKSNFLTPNEDVTLRGIGEVRDTFDCSTSEKTERIGEIVLDGSDDEQWGIGATVNGATFGLVYFTKGTLANVNSNINYQINNRGLSGKNPYLDNLNSCWLYKANDNVTQFRIMLDGTQTTVDDFKTNVKNNPIILQYRLETPVTRSVVIGNGEDLSLDKTKVKLPRPLGKDEALEWNSSANHYQIIGYENGVKSVVEDCKELFNRYVIPLRDKIKTFVTSTASKLSLDLPYRKIRELIVPENFTIVLDNENDLITASWDEVVGATDYDVYLDGVFLARVNTNQYQRKEEIKGHLKVRAVNNLTKSAFTEEIYVLSVPNETFISLVENRYENGHVFTVTFADYSEIETGFRVRWSPDGREESYVDVEGVTGVGTVIKHTFTVPLVQDYIDIRVNSYNETGENPIVPPIHLEMSPTPMWTYKEVLGQVMLQWDNTINNTEHYVLKYRIDGTDEYVYDTILSDGLDTLTGYIELGEKELAEVSLAGVVNGLTHVYCKPFKVGKSIDESLLPPQNFTYRTINESEFEFSWTDSYTCEREFELTLSHSDGRIERIIVPSTSSSTVGRKYTHRYKLRDYGYFGVKMRMNWGLGNSEYTQEYTIYYLPTVVEPPAYLRKERRESEVSLQWEAQSYVDHYALHLSINGDEVEYEVKNNHYEFKINFEEEPEIRAYIRTHFLDGKVSSSSSILRFRPCYSPNPYTAIMVNTVEEEKVLDCNITSPNVAQYYPLYTGSISSTEVAYPVSMSSVTKFTMIELPLTTEFWGKSLETVGHIVSYICRSGVEQSQYPLSTLTYKPTKSVIPILETIFLNYVYEALVNTEINPVRITTIGDSITAGHPNHWAETGTGDVRSQYQYWLNRKLNGQYEILNKGYGSDTTDKMVARFDKDVLETHPQYCIIQGGTNDLYWAMAESNGDQTALDRKLEVMKSNITQMVQKCIANNIIPIVGTLIPRTGATGIYQKALFDYNDWIIQYCNGLETAYYVDFFNAGKNNIPPTPLEDPTNRGALNPIYDGDAIYDEYGNLIKQGRGIHPNIEGYKIMADSIPTSIFQSQDSGLKLYLDSECTREEELDTSDKMNPFYTISIEGARRGKPKTFVRYVKNAGIGQVLYAMYHTNPHNINVRFINDKGETRPHGNGLLPSGHSHPVYIEVTPLTHDSVSKIDLHLAGREFKTKS